MTRQNWILTGALLLLFAGLTAAGIHPCLEAQTTPPAWSTYVGSSADDANGGIIRDADGSVTLTMSTTSTTMPATTGLQTANAGGEDAFIARFAADGTLLWATYFGGSGNDNSVRIARNSNGKCTITGLTGSSDLPGTTGAYQPTNNGGGDAFLAQFGADGTLLWATYYGGSLTEQFAYIATDPSGNIFLALVSPLTKRESRPITPGVFSVTGNLHILKFSEAGTLLWVTQHGNGQPWGSFATDAQGNLLLTGNASAGFPVTSGAWQPACAGGQDAFILKYSGAGARLWSTYFGGSENDWARGLAVDGNGDAVITGYTWSPDLPVSPGAYQTTYADVTPQIFDAYLAKFSGTGSRLWATYYGGAGSEAAYTVTTDVNNNITIGGYTSSTAFPVSPGSFQSALRGGADGILVQFSSGGSRNWATYFGGDGSDMISSIATDPNATLYCTGGTRSTDLPMMNAWQPSPAGGADVYIMPFDASGLIPGYNRPPVAVASAVPQHGNAPLTVSFSSAASYDPDGSIVSYAWNFGDGGSSTSANPTHQYLNPGLYTTELTVTDNGAKTATASVTITVSDPNAYVFVSDQTVTRLKVGNKWKGVDVVTVKDHLDLPVAGAVVTASYTGPNSGSVSGTTGTNGTVTLNTALKPSPIGTWCFTVTGVTMNGYTFNSTIGEITACEGTPKARHLMPAVLSMDVRPNPFNPSTVMTYTLPEDAVVELRVYDLIGREVALLVSGSKLAGEHVVVFDARALPSGMYYYRLTAGGNFITGSMTLLK